MRGGRLWLVAAALVVLLAAWAVAPVALGRNLAVLAVLAAPLALSVLALLDSARRPEWVWALAGRRRVVWMVMILAGMCVMVVGLVVSILYLWRIRPELRDAEDGRLRP